MTQSFSFQQRTSQTQTQRMSQRQIQSLNLLAMGIEDLRDEIFAEAEKNPALEIQDDGFENDVKSFRVKSTSPSDYLRVGTSSAEGEEKSQAFQEILESRPDERKTLYEHLMEQLSVAKVSAEENALCKKIIGNLDGKGFFILAPITLMNPAIGETPALLEKCLSIVRNFDPSGICVSNIEESLLLQARQKKSAPPIAIFLLAGHFEFLNPPNAQKVLKKIQDFIKTQKKLSFNKTDFSSIENIDADDVQDAIDFIKTLEPFPARNFYSSPSLFITPDIFVQKIPYELESIDFKNLEIPAEKNYSFKIKISDKMIPRIKISSDFAAAQKNSEFARAAVKQANVFLESLEFRETTIAKAACVIVQKQLEFFKHGAGHLVPLRQQDVAQEIGVHESTISRMALSKYIQCEWGLFPVKYFFTNAATSSPSPSGADAISKENVQVAIQKILQEHSSEKKLSDQKIADILEERGIKVARRTIAKYRSQLNIDSSYNRE